MTSRSPLLTVNGVTRTTHEWAADVGISTRLLSQRIRQGVPVEVAVAHGKQPARAKDPVFTQLDKHDELARAMRSARMQWVIRRCLCWVGPDRERLTDDEVADVVALVHTSPHVRSSIVARGGCVAHLCRAAVARRASKPMASREMLVA